MNLVKTAVPDDPNKPLKWPLYKQAVDDLMAMNPKPGMEITDEWLKHKFELDNAPKVMTEEEYDKHRFTWLEQFSGFRDMLLMEHNIDIRRVPGGYKILHPKEQTENALAEYERRVNKLWHRSKSRLSCVDYSALTDQERQQNIEARVRLAEIKRQMKPSKKLSMRELLALRNNED